MIAPSEVLNAPAFGAEFAAMDAEIFQGAEQTRLRLPLPWLHGDTTEFLFPQAQPAGNSHGFLLHQAGELLLGCAVQNMDPNPVETARDLYRRLLGASAGRSLYRIWNYVPAINAHPNGMENYRAFCAGRAQAFETVHGTRFTGVLPAASAVGCAGHKLGVVFVAGPAAPRYLENPEQIAAYHYPPEHGIRSPSFSRATVATQAGRPLVFVSGTAAIKGHATVAPGALAAQIDCTLDNLRIISRAAGLGESLGAGTGLARHFKIYLRHAADLGAVRARVERELLRPEDRVIYLRADICRAELLVEIEVTLIG